MPAAVATNGVSWSPEAFADTFQYCVAFNFATEYNLAQETLTTLLKQRTHSGFKNRTPYKQNKFFKNAVRLQEKNLQCHGKGCRAYTAKHAQAASYPCCKVELCNSQEQPAKITRYWKSVPWLTLMLADPDIGRNMILLNKDALADAGQARTVFKDIYEIDICRDLVINGIIKSPMEILMSLGPTDTKPGMRAAYNDGMPCKAL